MSGDASRPPSSCTERIATVTTTTKSIAMTIATTARMNRTTIQRDCRRVAACRAKKSIPQDLSPGRAAQANFTAGTSRLAGDSISSSCAGWNANMFATMLPGNTSRLLL